MNYLELCNACLDELFYEEIDSFEELDDITEGKKVKRDINSSLLYICNNETVNWKFRKQDLKIMLVGGLGSYDIPNGYIEYIRYMDTPIVLNYIEDHEQLPIAFGMPTQYWIENNKLKVFPIPSENQTGRLLNIEFNTYDYAMDCCGVLKPKLELEDDEPIIPVHHHDIIKWKVCADWRRSINDSQAAFYQRKFKSAYKALLDDQRQTYDYPNGFDMFPLTDTAQGSILRAFHNPRTDRIV